VTDDDEREELTTKQTKNAKEEKKQLKRDKTGQRRLTATKHYFD
jgi:hypothetical protein